MMRPHEATFTSGPYGHGSRVYAKVVETVVARLEKRLAADAGEHAAGVALAAKVDKAWRETYKRSLPSEDKVKQELKRLAPTGVRLFPSEAGSDPVGLNPSTTAGVGENHLAALSSGLWQTAGATRQPYVRKKSKRLLAAEAEAAARRSKRRFVLKAAAARGIGGSGSGSSNLGRKKRPRTNDGAAVNAARDDRSGVAGEIRGGVDGTGGSVRAGPGQAAVGEAGRGANAPGVAGAVVNARDASGSSPPVEGGAEGRNGHGGSGVGGGELGRAVDRAAAGQEPAGEQEGEKQGTAGGRGGKRPGRGGEPPEEAEDEEEEDDDDDDDDFSLEPKRRSPVSSTAAAAASGGGGGAPAACAGADALRGEAGTGRKAQDAARENGPGSATRRQDPAGSAANKGKAAANGEFGGGKAVDRVGNAAAVATAAAAAEEDDVHNGLAGAAVPDVAVTANYVGELLKGRHRLKWRLYLEGGVIEGKDQLFVFDECECVLDPPQ